MYRELFNINTWAIISKILRNEEKDLLKHVNLFVREAKKRAKDLDLMPVLYGGYEVTWKNGLATAVLVNSTDAWHSFA